MGDSHYGQNRKCNAISRKAGKMDKKDIAKRKLDLLMRSIERVGKIGETLEELKAAAFEVLLLNHGSERSRWGVDHVAFATKVFTTKQSSVRLRLSIEIQNKPL